METHALAHRLKTFMDANSHVDSISAEAMQKLAAAVEEFQLAPDALIDVKRLPSSVVDFQTLVDYLLAIKKKISDRPAGTDNQNWEVAKSGELKLYKLFACGMHAVNGYLTQDPAPNLGKDIQAVGNDVFAYGGTNAPDGLSSSGVTLWKATFDSPAPRTHTCLRTILFMLRHHVDLPLPASSENPSSQPPEIEA